MPIFLLVIVLALVKLFLIACAKMAESGPSGHNPDFRYPDLGGKEIPTTRD